MSTKIFYAGDSTVQYNDIHTYPQTGIGQVLGLFMTSDTVIENHARNGRSTKSFIAEGRLEAIDKRLQKDDILLIQFGHNDEKLEDPLRGTKAYGEFQENLKKFIETARKHGAWPVLITPVYRRHFDADGTIQDNVHLNYPAAMLLLAEEECVPCIDLCRMSKEYLAKTGDEASKELFMNFAPGIYRNEPEGKEDNTHLRYAGAVRFAGMVVKGLYELGGRYRKPILLEKELD